MESNNINFNNKSSSDGLIVPKGNAFGFNYRALLNSKIEDKVSFTGTKGQEEKSAKEETSFVKKTLDGLRSLIVTENQPEDTKDELKELVLKEKMLQEDPEILDKDINRILKYLNTSKYKHNEFEKFIALYKDPDFENQNIEAVLKYADCRKYPNGEFEKVVNLQKDNGFPYIAIKSAIAHSSDEELFNDIVQKAKDLYADPDFSEKGIDMALKYADTSAFKNNEFEKYINLYKDADFPNEHITEALRCANKNKYKNNEFKDVITLYKDKTVPNKIVYESVANYGLSADEVKNIQAAIKDDFKTSSATDLSIINNMFEYINVKDIVQLNSTQKRELLNNLLKSTYDLTENTFSVASKYVPILPNGTQEYSALISKLKNSLGFSPQSLSEYEALAFEKNLINLTTKLSETDLSNLKKVQLSYSAEVFSKDVSKALLGLDELTQLKVQDAFSFKIVGEKVEGYPSANDLASVDGVDSDVIDEVANYVKKYNENNILTIDSYPQIETMLNKIAKDMPEIYNQMLGDGSFATTVKKLQQIAKDSSFKELNNSDKKVLILATLLENTGKSIDKNYDSSFDAYYISQKFNLNDNETKKLYKTVQQQNAIMNFLNMDETQNRLGAIRHIAFNLKEGNDFELAQILAKTKEFTTSKNREVDFEKLTGQIKRQIDKYKQNEIVLPQTNTQDIMDVAQKQNVQGYDVKIANASDIKDFYAFVHTPELSFSSKETSRLSKLANLNSFSTLGNDKIVCTSYIANKKYAVAKSNGVIFEVPKGNVYAGAGYDLGSLARLNTERMTDLYYTNAHTRSKFKALNFQFREKIPNELKKILGKDFDYAQSISDIKEKTGNTVTLEDIKLHDKKLYDAFVQYLSLDNGGNHRFGDALMRSEGWNEVLVSNPTIQGIYTKDLEKLPKEYVEFAQQQDIPIVVLD